MPRRPPRLPPLLAEFDDDEREAVLAANRAFYRAFTGRDVEAMGRIWAPSGAVVCLHPGRAPLHDRAEIMASWHAIMLHPQAPQIRCIDEWVVGRAGLAIVVCREILANAELMATNSFVRLGDGWHMVGHHSGQVPPREQEGTTAPNPPPAPDKRRLH
jgi:hypothetical protein